MHETPDLNIAWLMDQQSADWTDEAGCANDDRFTAKHEWLTVRDLAEMTDICLNCPVFAECDKWARENKVVDVFAASYWWGDGYRAGYGGAGKYERERALDRGTPNL